MGALLTVTAPQLGLRSPVPAEITSEAFRDVGVTKRLACIGLYLRSAGAAPGTPLFRRVAGHDSDVVRQWAAYSLMADQAVSLRERLQLTRTFAADRNMSVREVAWMTFRPYVVKEVSEALAQLRPLTVDHDPNVRRFAIEVTRPRSVWGEHLRPLKAEPEQARELLDATKADRSKYVQDAVANWLNDASKTRPDWVLELAATWMSSPSIDAATKRILIRGVRTLRRADQLPRHVTSLLF
jgi:3-methyladenine DNA glycosylase AlkC